MTFSPADLGVLSTLATALGLVEGSGFSGSWLSDPGAHLSAVLAKPAQRDALIAFVDEVLGDVEHDAAGLVWMPVVTHTAPQVSVCVVLDDTPADHVAVGVGAKLTGATPASVTTIYVPVYRAAKEDETVDGAILIGTADAVVRLTTDITIGTGPPLVAVGVTLDLPTDGSAPPTFGLTLRGLLLPGAAAPRDVTVAIDAVEELEEVVLDLVLGLARVQADAVGGPLRSLVSLLGLSDGSAIPPLPLTELHEVGVTALATWFESVVSPVASRAEWLGHLAGLLGGAVAADAVTLDLGVASILLGVQVTTAGGGHAVVTPTLAVFVAASADARASVDAELLRLDLATATALALPHLSAYVHLGLRPDGGGTRLLTGDPRVDALRAGITLDEGRRPTFLLAADGVRIAGHDYATLDLTTPDALAEVAGSVLGDVMTELLGRLGPAATAIGFLLGVQAPPSAAGIALLDAADFIADPLGAVRAYWLTLVRDHAVAVPDVLERVRDLVADATRATRDVSGTGTDVDPWSIPIVGPVTLDAWATSGGTTLHLAVAASFVMDTLGNGCTRVETSVTAELAELGLDTPRATLLPSVDVTLTARARGKPGAFISAGSLMLSADHVGMDARWTPAGGVTVGVLAPNLTAELDGVSVDVVLPAIGADGHVTLDADAWDAVERLLAALGQVAPLPWVSQLVDALGWASAIDEEERPRLRLADLAASPTDAVKSWLTALALDEDGVITRGLRALAQSLTGSFELTGAWEGAGTEIDPYRVSLLPGDRSPAVAVWLLPDGPERDVSEAPDPLRRWQPGQSALAPWVLEEGLQREAAVAADVADLVSGRTSILDGIALLEARWVASDGRVVPPTVDPAGITVHRFADVERTSLAGPVDIGALLGAPPDTRIDVAVVADGAPLPWPGAPPNRVIDVRAPGLAPEAFAVPTAAAGEWFVALAERADARLASGDTDGIAGQAARLTRVLSPFAAVGGRVVIIATEGAGHAALAAANALTFVPALVTLGTAFSPVSFTVIDDPITGDTLRLLRWLLPPVDAEEPDDADLALGRALVDGLVDLIALADPAVELRPPAVPVTPREGLAVHACFGVLTAAPVRRALTAIVAAGLSTRAMARAEAPSASVTGVRGGLHVPFATGSADLTVSGVALVELVGADAADRFPEITTRRVLTVRFELRRTNGWLSGGPNGIDPPPPAEVRWVSATVVVPLDDGGGASAEIVLHEPTVFGIARERWVVCPAGTGGDVATTALPEIRVLLSLVAEQIAAAAGTSAEIAIVRDALAGLGLLDAGGASIPDGIDHFLHDTAAHIADAVADAARRAQLAAGISAALTGVPGVSVDLTARELSLDTAGTPGEEGMVASTATLVATATGSVTGDFTLGSAGTTAAGGAIVRVAVPSLRASVDWYRAGESTPETFALWPDPDANGVARVLARIAFAECARSGIEFLRSLDETATTLIDTALDLVGLLGAPDANGLRRVWLPVGLIENAAGWLTHGAALGGTNGIDPGRAIALMDALKPLAGIAGPPGTWTLAPGFAVTATSQAGQVRLALAVDTSAVAAPSGADGRLTAGGSFALTLRPDAAPTPSVDAWVGLSGAPPGSSAVHVVLDGGLQVFLRPGTGTDVALYPNPSGLGALVQGAVTQALPFVLDALAALTGTGVRGSTGALVRAIGDALAMRTGTPLAFDGARLSAWAADPAGQLATVAPTLTTPAMQALASALTPVLPAGATATFSASTLTVTLRQLTLTWRLSPLEITLNGTFTGIAQVRRVRALATLSSLGLAALEVTVGPGDLDAGGVRLRPLVTVAAGVQPAGGRRIEVGLSGNAAGTTGFVARWSLGGPFALVTLDGGSTDPDDVAQAILDEVLDLVAAFVIDTAAVQQLLGNPVGTSDVRRLLAGVVLEDVANPVALDDHLFDPDGVLGRVLRLGDNFAEAAPSIALSGGLTLGAVKEGALAKLVLGVTGRAPVSSGNVIVSLEADSRWIEDQPEAGLALTLLRAGAHAIVLAPALEANGVGVRLAGATGPLVDTALTLGSVALHLFGKIEADGKRSGGVQLQLSDLKAAVAGAQGGNPVAQGIMQDASSGSTKLAPTFSPALAVQKHRDQPVLISLSAGEGSGPWWVAIQESFGPVYIEQVGFGVTVTGGELSSISLLLDGRVSLFGLTAAVDDLQLTFVVASDASLFDPARWAVDLAGFALDADLAGITLSGGLRKFGDGDSVEYVGMLLARFAVYGLSVYGGYGTGLVDGARFDSFFAFGAINGPIGGPPAFFLTGIGGGVGINRGLTFPSDLSTFDQFPFIKALDPAAEPASDPMAELASMRTYFPMAPGELWFAAGISFTSFALVDGVAVVSVAIGDGLELALLGLARMALPRPQFPLVSVELGLIARFSTSEGVLWVQAQLTDNSWILHESVRLTGGFAFVTWFDGPNQGEFVLTLGGYHPSFKRDGYPVVPRLGFQWSVSSVIAVKGEAYFALTSEAVMAGGALTAAADFGAAWASVKFVADGIVYFEPFRYDVTVSARIAAGLTIDTWLGDVSFSLSTGSSIHVMGPEFHGSVSFDIGPIKLTVAFGDDDQSDDTYLGWAEFVPKYLEEASAGVARVITAIPGKGALPPGTGPGGATDTATADGTAARPFEVYSEFEITVTTLVPTSTLRIEGVDEYHAPSSVLGIAPMNIASADSVLDLSLRGAGNTSWLRSLIEDVQEPGAFPVGVWGPPQPTDDRKVPKGDAILATNAVRFEAAAPLGGTLPTEIAYDRIDPPGPRKPLPLISAAAARPVFIAKAHEISRLLDDDAPGTRATYAKAKPWLAAGGTGRTALAALERERSAPPRLGTLTQGLAGREPDETPLKPAVPGAPPPVDMGVRAPRAIAILTPGAERERPRLRTTVNDREPARVTAPTLDSVQSELLPAIAATLVRVPSAAVADGGTMLTSGAVPLTRAARGASAAVAMRGAAGDGAARLDALSRGLAARAGATSGRTASVRAGEIAVLQLPNALRDLDIEAARPRLTLTGGAARVVVLAHGGRVLADDVVTAGATIPRGAERLVVLALGKRPGTVTGVAGWHGGQELPFVGWSSALAPGVVVQAEGGHVRMRRQRFRAGWIEAAELVDASAIVHTRFAESVRTVAIVLDDRVGTSSPSDVQMTLQQGTRPAGADGAPLAPVVVTAANRSVLLYAVAPDSVSKRGDGLVVSIARQRGVRVSGVFGAAATPAMLADRVARAGLDALLRPLVENTAGEITLGWSRSAPAPKRRS